MTFIATSRDFLQHDMAGHPESAQRLAALFEAARTHPALRRLEHLEPDRAATDAELLAVHTRRLLLAARDASDAAPAWLDPDTYVTPASDMIARKAARVTLQAAERALSRNECGLVWTRPPGHHATRDRSMGFCLYNNVAVAAQSLLNTGSARRVLVFDHDVHHGNGTEDIFRDEGRVMYQSFHLAPHYPGTGAVEESGSAGTILNAPLAHGMGEPHVRAVMEEAFLPAGRKFKPDLILVSAGYDSLEGDPLGGLRLSPAFFGEMAARLREVCPRIISVLEGGYQVERIPLAAAAQAEAFEEKRWPRGPTETPPSLTRLLQNHPYLKGL